MSSIEHFLKAEIYICQQRAENYYSDCFNGVSVGIKPAKTLNDKHILFCKHLLKLIEKDKECEYGGRN